MGVNSPWGQSNNTRVKICTWVCWKDLLHFYNTLNSCTWAVTDSTEINEHWSRIRSAAFCTVSNLWRRLLQKSSSSRISEIETTCLGKVWLTSKFQRLSTERLSHFQIHYDLFLSCKLKLRDFSNLLRKIARKVGGKTLNRSSYISINIG